MIVREIVTELIQAKRVDLITDRTQDKPFEEKSQIVVGRSLWLAYSQFSRLSVQVMCWRVIL